MGDINGTDCSWKKMLIAKTNNEWVSTIKTEITVEKQAMDSADFSIDEEETPYHNVKSELMEEMSNDHDLPDIIIEPVSMIRVVKAESKSKSGKESQQRRRSSVPKNETPEERATRLAKMSAYAAQRLANETPEQRSLRLKRMSEYAAKRLARETSEQRAQRLARMSAYAAKRLAEETPEKRRTRLERMSAYAARRHATEWKKFYPNSKKFSSDTEGTSPDQS